MKHVGSRFIMGLGFETQPKTHSSISFLLLNKATAAAMGVAAAPMRRRPLWLTLPSGDRRCCRSPTQERGGREIREEREVERKERVKEKEIKGEGAELPPAFLGNRWRLPQRRQLPPSYQPAGLQGRGGNERELVSEGEEREGPRDK